MYNNRKRKGSEFTTSTTISTTVLLLYYCYYYYYITTCYLGRVPGRLADGNGFHAKGSVLLLGAASSKSDGATCDLLARECEEVNKLFFGRYTLVNYPMTL